jgi:hypothetical protein
MLQFRPLRGRRLIGRSLRGRGLGGSSHNAPGGGTDLSTRILLSSEFIAEDAEAADLVGTLSVVNGSGSYTFSITADPDSKFVLDVGDNTRLELEDTVDYETATSHQVTIEADNGVDDPISRTFTIRVTDVAEGGGSAGEAIGLLLVLTKAA